MSVQGNILSDLTLCSMSAKTCLLSPQRRVSIILKHEEPRSTYSTFITDTIVTLQLHECTMSPLFVLLGFLGAFATYASATALTYKLPPNGKECFFANIAQKQAKVAFYFAVCIR